MRGLNPREFMKACRTLLSVALVLAGTALLRAAPVNDNFANALVISGTTNTVTGTNTLATEEAGEPDHGGAITSKSVWWRWTSPVNSAVVLDCLSTGPSFSPAIGVYTGSAVSALSPIAGASGFFLGSPSARVGFAARSGITYRIAVDSISSAAGVFNLTLRTVPPPTNDNFGAAASISGSNIVAQGTIYGGTPQTGEPGHSGDMASVWYRWTAPRAGRVRLSCEERVTAYSGTLLANLAEVSRRTPDLGFVAVFEAAAQASYYIAVSGSPAQESPFSLRLVYGPPNDDFGAAVPLSEFADQVQGSTIGASLETGEPGIIGAVGGSSVWWTYKAPASGELEFSEGGGDLPPLRVYEGASVSGLTLLARNHVPNTDRHLKCLFTCDVVGGRTYYIAATGFDAGPQRIETNFVFDVALKVAPPNDAFKARMVVEPSATVAFSSTVGATREIGEPGSGSNTVWWSWTPTRPGPVILTTYGSACDTIMGVYVGNSPGSLVQVGSNNDCFLWNSNATSPTVGWTTAGGPTNDVISRFRLNADNGVEYKIAISVSPTNQPAGQVALNLARLAIEDILAVRRSTNANGSIGFQADLRLVNLQTNASSRLRLRLVAQPGYSYNFPLYYNCPWNFLTVPDIALGTVGLPAPGTLQAGGNTQVTVAGNCPPSVRPELYWGYGYGVIAVLEEQDGTDWRFQDARMILVGEWPEIGGQSGPGGGVVLVSAALRTGDEVGYLDVKIGPPAAVRLGGAWRVSPTNYGELGELRPYTTYRSNDWRLAIRSRNFSIQTRPLNGFDSPPNQTVTIQPEAIVPLDLNYAVDPPRLAFDRARGLGVTGTPQTAYRIQQVTNLPPTTWFIYTNVTLGPGVTWLPQTTNTFSNRFYRAFWLSN